MLFLFLGCCAWSCKQGHRVESRGRDVESTRLRLAEEEKRYAQVEAKFNKQLAEAKSDAERATIQKQLDDARASARAQTRGYAQGEMASQPADSPTIAGNNGRAQVRINFAKFVGDMLAECGDFSVIGTPLVDAGMDWQERLEADVQKMARNVEGSVVLAAPCAEQFADRKPFATCTISFRKIKNSVDSEFTITDAHYLFSTVFRSDQMMKECLEAGGKWDAISRDSQEYRRARLEESSSRAKELLDKALRGANTP